MSFYGHHGDLRNQLILNGGDYYIVDILHILAICVEMGKTWILMHLERGSRGQMRSARWPKKDDVKI